LLSYIIPSYPGFHILPGKLLIWTYPSWIKNPSLLAHALLLFALSHFQYALCVTTHSTATMGRASSTPTSLNFVLQNQTTSNTVYAYITGQAINNNNALVLLQADGKSLYYPTSPASNGSPLAVDCGIQLGPPGSNAVVTIPQIAGGRIWFCIGSPLTFLLNPGPGLVRLFRRIIFFRL
jgi:hypothetical protein